MSDLTRRGVLRRVGAAGAVGAAGLGAGAGTYALLGDSESFTFSSASGTLDLQVATSQSGIPTDYSSESSVLVAFPSFPPNEQVSGSMTVGLRSCTNPALASLHVPDIADSSLADYIDVKLTYQRSCTDSEAGAGVVYDGPLSGLPDASAGGLPLHAGDCREIGKLEYDDQAQELAVEGGNGVPLSALPHTFTLDGVELTVTDVVETEEDDEVIGLDVETAGAGLCRVDVKGGGKQSTAGNNQGNGNPSTSDGVVTYNLGCATNATDLVAGLTPSGKQSGLSHVTFSVCEGERQCIPCDDPACVDFDWTYSPPTNQTLAELENADLVLRLVLTGRQCRHQLTTSQ